VSVFLGFTVLMLFIVMVDWLVDVFLVDVILMEVVHLGVEVVGMDLVEMVLMDDVLMIVVFVNEFFGVVMIVNHFLGSGSVGIEMLDGVTWFVDPAVAVGFTDVGWADGVGIFSVEDLLSPTAAGGAGHSGQAAEDHECT